MNLTRRQKKAQRIASLTDRNAALSKQLEESSKVSKELDEARASTSQLKEQQSLELAKQRTKLVDACKHYQNTLKDEQGKLELKEEELGAANSEISRIKSEAAAKTDAVEAQKVLVVELQQDVGRLEVTTFGSLLWDSLTRSMPGDGKATVTRYQGLGKAKQ